jgi:hypothetical protein
LALGWLDTIESSREEMIKLGWLEIVEIFWLSAGSRLAHGGLDTIKPKCLSAVWRLSSCTSNRARLAIEPSWLEMIQDLVWLQGWQCCHRAPSTIQFEQPDEEHHILRVTRYFAE